MSRGVTAQYIDSPVHQESISEELVMGTLHDSWRVIRSPGKWRSQQWLTFGVVAAGVGTGFLADEPLQEYFAESQSPAADFVATNIGEPFGNPKYVFTGALAIYFSGRLFKEPSVSAPALVASKSIIVGVGATYFFKLLFHRVRPRDGTPPDAFDWHGPSLELENLSFPSGHSTVAFALASSVSKHFSEYPLVGWIAYPLAATAAWSRVYDNHHWVSDVIAGAALGTFIGRTVAQPDLYSWSVAPNIYGGWSVNLAFEF